MTTLPSATSQPFSILSGLAADVAGCLASDVSLLAARSSPLVPRVLFDPLANDVDQFARRLRAIRRRTSPLLRASDSSP